MNEIHLLLPIPVMKSQVSYVLSKEQKSQLNNSTYRLFGNGTYQDIDYRLLDKDIFFDLKQKLQEQLTSYTKDIFKYDCEVYITHSWMNVNPNGSDHKIHNHANSIFSGVYYIDVPHGTSGLTFHSTRKPMLDIFPLEYNEFNSPSWTINVASGDVVLFPSEIYHSVQTNPCKENRTCIAFNSFVRGYIGEKNESNYQEIL
jgi:uncharacterized protein (TIGR02466 family)